MNLAPVLVSGQWQAEENPQGDFHAHDPKTGRPLSARFPVSGEQTLTAMLAAGSSAAESLRVADPERIAAFLELCAEGLEARADALIESAQAETGLPASPRLAGVELPRTTGQLRQAARATRERSFCEPVIETEANIRLMRGPLGGPIAIFGPNNFPFAFNAVMGGDFAAAIAAGNPVICKGHPCHPETTRLLAEAALEAATQSGLPKSTVQLVYALPSELGLELVSHPAIAASAFTGSRRGGLALKQAADRAGKPIYLEMSAVNPLFVLPGALRERCAEIAQELSGSCTLGAGQFCTKPGLSVVPAGELGTSFAAALEKALGAAPVGALFGPDSAAGVAENVATLRQSGAELACGGKPAEGDGFRFSNTLLTVSGARFLEQPAALQTEAFGAVHLMVLAADLDEMVAIAKQLEGSLTGCLYTDSQGSDDAAYARIERHLRPRVGRLLNDKMPTGVAVSPAMNHGGPYPSTGHPGFTSVGLPGSIARFTALQCYDGVRPHRLPPELRDENPTGKMWRRINGEWTQENVA